MTDHSQSDPYADRRYDHAARSPWQRTAERLLDYLRSRPGETWAFFAAGLVVGAILT
ncbi:MAG: hypothetical protein GVY28_05230 [Alphaproteobacteria bacterium]|jgi:hypothetical protein|nr:hypothetical protein [Alphaproteobacteria bacterium]